MRSRRFAPVYIRLSDILIIRNDIVNWRRLAAALAIGARLDPSGPLGELRPVARALENQAFSACVWSRRPAGEGPIGAPAGPSSGSASVSPIVIWVRTLGGAGLASGPRSWAQRAVTILCWVLASKSLASWRSRDGLDALAAFGGPILEVRVSGIHQREPFRHCSHVSRVAVGVIAGCGARDTGWRSCASRTCRTRRREAAIARSRIDLAEALRSKIRTWSKRERSVSARIRPVAPSDRL